MSWTEERELEVIKGKLIYGFEEKVKECKTTAELKTFLKGLSLAKIKTFLKNTMTIEKDRHASHASDEQEDVTGFETAIAKIDAWS